MKPSPHDITALLAFHRQTFGSAVMEDAPPAGDAPQVDAPPAGDKTFTQADLDRVVAERLARAKPKDYDDLKTKAAEFDKLREASQSDLEKAVAAARKETEDAIRGEVRRERVLDRVEVLAAKDFADPEDARLRLEKRADDFVGKDGAVDAEAISAALTALLKDKPHLAAKSSRPSGDVGQGPRGTATVDPGPGTARMRAAYSTTP